MKTLFTLFLACTLVACQSTHVAEKDSPSTAEPVSFSKQRLDRIAPVMQEYITKVNWQTLSP
jgi:hypothetical protein